MNTDILTQTNTPQLHALIAESSAARDTLRALAGKSILVRFVRGKKATTLADFYNEMSAALQFPLYFGGNWDALADCLGDPSGLEAEHGMVVVISDAGRLLESAGPADLDTFARVISATCAHWRQAKHQPFHVVFMAENEGGLGKRWGALPKLAG